MPPLEAGLQKGSRIIRGEGGFLMKVRIKILCENLIARLRVRGGTGVSAFIETDGGNFLLDRRRSHGGGEFPGAQERFEDPEKDLYQPRAQRPHRGLPQVLNLRARRTFMFIRTFSWTAWPSGRRKAGVEAFCRDDLIEKLPRNPGGPLYPEFRFLRGGKRDIPDRGSPAEDGV